MALPDEQIIKNTEGGIPDPTAKPFITYPSKFSPAPLDIGTSGADGGQSSILNTALFLTNPIQKNSRLNSGSFVTYNPNDIDLSGRYDRWILGADNEDLSGKLQSGWDQAANGLLKGLGIAGTTFLQGTAGLVYGLGAAVGQGELNKFYNNDFSNFMADLNKSMETALPNYYTAVERNANWYSPDNWFTANFFWDKIIKNLGFSVGALGSGAAVAGALSKVPTLFGLSKAGMIGKVSAALEEGLAGVPQIERAAKAQSIIMENAKLINTINKLSTVERGVVAGLSAATEGGIEALQGLNDYRDKLIDQYRKTFGTDPVGEDLNAINEKAEDLGNARFGLNMLLLTGTNYIQIPRILGGSYSAGRNNLVNAVRNNFEKGMLESALPTKGFPKLLYKAKNVAGLFISPTEGFEEGAQYAIEKGVESYYNKKDYSKDQSLNQFISSLSDAAGEGIRSVADKEGMESVLIGALSGGIQQAGFVGRYTTPEGKTSFGFGKSGELAERGWTGYGGALAKNTAELAKAAPFTLKGDNWLKDNIDATKRAVVLQEEFDKQVRQGDFLEAKDNQFDYQHNYLTPRIKYGRFDLVMDDISFYRSTGATQEGLDQLKQKGIASELDTIESFGQRLNNFKNHATLVKTLQETYKLSYGSLVDKTTNKPLYSDEAIDKMVYAAAKIADYDRRIPEISAKLVDAGINVTEIVESVLTGKPEAKQLIEDAFSKIDKIETPGLADELKVSLEDVNELSLRRKQFLSDYNDIKANPLKYTTKTATPADPTVTGETITIKTVDGEKQVAVGERYVGGSKEIQTKEGVTINKFTEFDVVGTNDKGDIVIKTLDGKIHNVTPKAFEEYGLAKSSELGRTGRFYIDNSDKIFNFRKKGGKEIPGYVVYDKKTKTLFFESIEKKPNGNPVSRIPVKLEQFQVQEGYSRPQIWSNQRFSPETEALLQEAPTQEEKDAEANLEQKLNSRRAIIKEIHDDAKERIESIDKQITSKKEELAKINEDLKELGEVKVAEAKTKREKALEAKYPELSRQKIRFSKVFSKTSRALLKLARLKETLQDEIAQLEGEKDNLEANVTYFEDFLQNMRELPENVFDLVQELKDQVEGLKDLTKSTGKQIVQLNEMSDDIDETLRDLTKWLKDALQKFDSEYPADIRDRAQKIIESKTISFLEVSALKDAISDYALIQDLTKEISTNQGILDEVTASLEKLTEKLDEVGKEQRAKEIILKKFEDIVSREVKRIKEERAVSRDEAVINQILGTMNQGVQNREYQRGYEPDSKMSAVAAATSTSAPSEKSFATTKEDVAEHHARANRFGARMPNLPNAGEIKGVIVTSATEGDIIPGLTNHLKQGKEEIKAETTIALVMAIPNKDGKGYTLIDENGVPIAERAADESNEDYQNRILNSAIYQTFPINIESRFRESVPQEVRMKLVNSYDEWRNEKLAETTLKNYDVRPSFGFTEKVQQPTKDGLGFETDYNARVALQDSGLITEDDLGSRQLVYVPTTEETIALGSTSFTNALGRTFLITKNGYVPLNNRQHTAQEAETIHQVMVRLAEIIAEENTKGKFVYDQSLEAQRLVNWLRSVTYWGTPKAAAGYNSVWFQKTDNGLKLFMSGKTNEKGENIPICDFGAIALNENKGIITGALQKMYLNTNAKATSADYYNERYEQITGVNEDGSVSFVMWPNYQTYLLSKKNADGSARNGEEIPLTTNIRPLKNSEDVNKYGIYFTIDEKNIDKRFTDISPEGKTVTIQPEGKTAPKGKFVLDGKTENSAPIRSGEVELGNVRFTADESDLDGSVKILASTDESLINAVGQKLRDAGEVDDPEVVFNTLAKVALKKIREDLAAVTEQQAPAPTVTPTTVEEAPAPTAPTAAPVSSVDVTQQKTLFRAFEKAFYEGNDKRYENISDETLAKLSSATRQYLLNLYEALKPYNSTFQRLGKILDTQTSKELTTDDEKIKYVTSSYFGGLGRGSSEMGSSTNPKHKDLVMPVPSADVLGNINEVFGAKLTDAELAALEGAKPAEEKPNVADPGPAPTTEPKNFKGRKRADDPRYRRAGSLAVERMTEAELQEFKEWAAKNLPQIPYEVLEHMVNTHDNKKAWGVFEDGVAKFYKSAEKGTAYHELFEGVWKGLLSENMQQDLIDEFRERKGSFIDRASGRRIDFNEATNEEAREYIADEFAAFRAGKATARTLSQKLVDFFRSIINFFKSFVNKPTLKDELFKAIEKGEFKQKAYKDTNPSQMAAYRRVTGLNEQQTNEFVQDMTARLFQYVFNTNTSLFSPARITAGEIFGNIKEQFKNEGVFDYITDDTYNQLIDRTKEYLKYYRIEFDEDSRIGVNDEGATNRNYAAETFSVDFKKASPYAVKLLIGTLIKTKTTNQENSLSVTLPLYDEDASSTGGYTLVPFGKAFTTLMNTLSNTLDINQFVDKLYKLALQDGDYVRLFTRLGGDLSTGKIDFQGYKEPHDWRLFINFYQVFTKQNPNAVAQFVDEEKVYLASANQASTAKQFEKEWLNNMLLMADEPGTFIQLDRPTKTYKITNTDFKIGTPEEKIAFLNNIGINFTMDAFNKLKGRNIEKFGEAVSGILTSLKKKPALLSLRGKALDISGNLTTIASLYTKATNPIQDSTFFNMENKRQQSFTDSNTTSVLESIFNSVSTREELFEKLPRLRDVFSTNSQVLKLGGLFFDEEGNRTSRDLKVGYAAGVKDIANNTGKSTASLPLGARFTLEINQNLDGNYYVLIPADSSTEWMMQLGNVVSYADVASNAATEQINNIFRGYLKDEILLAASDKNRAKLKNVAGRGKQLRFFNDILPDSFKEKITSQLIDKNADDVAIDAFLAQDANVEAFEKAIADLIKTSVSQTKTRLIKSKELVVNKKGEYKYAKIDSDFVKDKGINKNNITEDQLTSLLAFTNVNYMINNIELHKILLGDPYQFATKSGKLEETKRVKSYLSPRRITFNIPEFNNFLNDYYNKAGDLQLTDDDYGYHEHKDFARTATISELFVAGSAGSVFPAYLKTKEADAASWMKDTLYREVKLKNGQWSDEAEAWHQWQMAFTRQNIPGYKYINEKLRKQDEALVKKPAPTHFIDVLKPIVTGSKFGRPYTDNVLDKFAQIPLYYSAVKGTSLEKLYIKMFNEGYDYVIMESGRKEGTEEAQPFYQPNGLFNDDAFNNMIDVPWSAYGLQVENSYDKDRGQTRGSQGVKISSMDLFENGQPISEEARKAMDRYNAVLNEMTENAYQEILTRLAIKDLGTSFEVEDKSQVAETLRQQMLKLQLSENAVDSISINPETGEFDIPFEASTNYTQIKQILYAIVNKSITSPKMSGMSAVQIPVTGWENAEEGRSLAIKRDGKYEKISREAFEKLSNDDKKDVVLTDDTLKFYEDKEGKRYCEVMLPNWFKKKLGRDMTDEEFNKFAKTDEGREILTGIGFRIPTQGLNSMDVFVVKGFLPSYMGKTVVVPSEITTKAGSDFDIDKLNTYLKNVYVTGDGKVKLVPYFGLGEEAKKKMGKWLIENDLTTILTDTDYAEYGDREDDYGAIADKLYKQSLENEYYSALQELLTIPQNFKRLMTPNNSKPLEKIATKLDTLRGFNEGNVKNQLINRVFLTGLRHSFVTAKAWVGIAATNITGHSLFQKEKMYVIDPSMTMVLPHNKVDVDGASHISLSGRLDQDGEFISDKLSMYANSFVDVANDPYIFKIIYSDRLVSTFLFLERAGVSMENVAMFMNQPIIREYMNYLDSINASRSGIYKNNNISYVKKMFPASVDLIKNVAININNFEGNISTYASKGSLTEIENAEQQAILAEFLKYAKLSDALFNITQATNYDTSSFKNADDLHRKQLRTDIEEALSMISSPKKILDISFLRGIERALDRATDALGAILKFNQFEFRGVIEDAINVYAANQYLGAEKFTKIAEKLSASFLDYIIQTKIANKLDVNELTASVESVANRIRKAKGQHPEVKMLQLFITEAPDRPGAPKTIALRSNPKEAFDENLHIGYMREMRDNPATADLYKDVVKVAILQGTYQSAVSIKNIVPLEDYAKVVSPIISPLQVDEDIRNFARGRKFERSNWKDENIVPRVTPTIDDENENELGEDIYGNVINQYFYKNFSGIASLGINEADRSILLVSISSKGSNNDVLVIPGIFKMKDEMIDFMRGETITPGDIASRRAQGDRSMDLVHGYMKVRDAFGKPILNPDNKFVYKRINLLGDGQYLTEHYVDNRPSAVDNGTYKVEAEIPDYAIVEAMAELQKTAAPRGFSAAKAPSAVQVKPAVVKEAISKEDLKTFVQEFLFKDVSDSIPSIDYATSIGLINDEESLRSVFQEFKNHYATILEAERALAEGDYKKAFDLSNKVPRPETYDDEGNIIDEDANIESLLANVIFNNHENLAARSPSQALKAAIGDIINDLSTAIDQVEDYKKEQKIAPEGLPAIDNNNQNNCG
jgi:hypothetical protein